MASVWLAWLLTNVRHLVVQLMSIYAAGNILPIPFLKATDISPISLISENLNGLEALQDLCNGGSFSEAQMRKVRKGANTEVRSCIAQALRLYFFSL